MEPRMMKDIMLRYSTVNSELKKLLKKDLYTILFRILLLPITDSKFKLEVEDYPDLDIPDLHIINSATNKEELTIIIAPDVEIMLNEKVPDNIKNKDLDHFYISIVDNINSEPLIIEYSSCPFSEIKKNFDKLNDEEKLYCQLNYRWLTETIGAK